MGDIVEALKEPWGVYRETPVFCFGVKGTGRSCRSGVKGTHRTVERQLTVVSLRLGKQLAGVYAELMSSRMSRLTSPPASI